jgi:hypothetical protein
MVSFKPSHGILQVIATHLRVCNFMACACKDWAQGVEAMKKALRRKFLNGQFNVDCLGHLGHSDAVLERRLLRVVRMKFGDYKLKDIALWWYRTQLYLSLSIGRNRTSFQGVLRQCYEYSKFSGYNFSMFKDLFRGNTSERLDGPLGHALFRDSGYVEARDPGCSRLGPLGHALFRDSGYVEARDLGCSRLGMTIDEVLWTLICANEGTCFCPSLCGCADEDVLMSM